MFPIIFFSLSWKNYFRKDYYDVFEKNCPLNYNLLKTEHINIKLP